MRTLVLAAFLAFILAVPIAHAQYEPLVFTELDPSAEGLGSFFNSLFDWAVLIGSGLAVILIAIHGFTYMTTDAVTQKTTSLRSVGFTIGGLLMLLGIWVFFHEINPRILQLDFSLEPTTISVEDTEQTQQTSASDTAFFPGRGLPSSASGQQARSFDTYQWANLSSGQTCQERHGKGWFAAQESACPGTPTSGAGACCGYDQSVVDEDEINLGGGTRVRVMYPADSGGAEGPYQGQVGIISETVQEDGQNLYTVEFEDETTQTLPGALLIRTEEDSAPVTP